MNLVDRYEVFVFDGDGVLYLDDRPLPGAIDTVHRLKGLGKTLRFITNDPFPSVREMGEKLSGMGFPFSDDEIFPVGRAVAAFLVQLGKPVANVLGSAGLVEELKLAGVEVTTGMDAEAVVLGYDWKVTLADYQRAGELINQGALFVAANLDLSFPTARGSIPASGSMVRALELATGVRARLVGKPSSYIFKYALRGVSPRRAVMLGDNPDSDIVGAHRYGMSGVLVGDGRADRYPRWDYRRPDARITALPELFSPGVACEPWEDPGFPWPDRVAPAVAAVLFDGTGRVLLIRRADNGYWALPTGHLERGESAEEAVVREVREETGLTVRVRSLTGVYSDPRSMSLTIGSGEVVQYVTTCYRCERAGGDLVPQPSEVRDVGYFLVSRLPSPLVESHRDWIRQAGEKTGR